MVYKTGFIRWLIFKFWDWMKDVKHEYHWWENQRYEKEGIKRTKWTIRHEVKNFRQLSNGSIIINE